MKNTIIIGLIFFCQFGLGQSNFNFDIKTRTGYEHNVFNSNINRVILINGIQESAVKSGYFQNAGIDISWRIKSKHNEFSLKGKFQKDYFPQIRTADLFRPDASMRYTLKFNKRHSFSVSGRFNSYRTNRPEDDTEVLRPPRAYDRYQLSAKYSLKLFSSNSIYIQARKLLQKYATVETREFGYNSMQSTFSMTQRLYNSDYQSHHWYLKSSYAERFYLDVNFDELTEEENIREREWKYYSLSSKYQWYIKKKFKMSIGMNVLERQDILQDKYGYRQYQPFIKIDIKGKKIEFSVKGSAARREYKTLKVNSKSDVLLVHEYLRASSNLVFKLSKKVHFNIQSSMVRRMRNLPEGATSFLSYDNAIVSIGFKLKVF